MNWKRISASFLAIAAVTLLVALSFRIRVGATADSVAILKTTGMTCGNCSRTISTALESLKGVAATEVDVEGGWVVVGYDTTSVQPATLAAKVAGAGFGSRVHEVLTPEQFRQLTGRTIGQKGTISGGCGGCGSGSCGTKKQS